MVDIEHRDKRIYDLKKHELSLAQIVDQIEKEFGQRLTRERIRQICDRNYKLNLYRLKLIGGTVTLSDETRDKIIKLAALGYGERFIADKLRRAGINLEQELVGAFLNNEGVQKEIKQYRLKLVKYIVKLLIMGYSGEKIIKVIEKNGYKMSRYAFNRFIAETEDLQEMLDEEQKKLEQYVNELLQRGYSKNRIVMLLNNKGYNFSLTKLNKLLCGWPVYSIQA